MTVAEELPYEKFSESWEDQFLSWFSGLGIPMTEKALKIGGLEYFHFSSLFTGARERLCGGFGSHQSRKMAALKCAAETIERREMLEYFSSDVCQMPKTFQTSNGWAVHRSLQVAQENALSEILERHLLLKSFLTSGWGGFNYIQKIVSPEVELHLLTTRFFFRGQVAALVIAKSPLYPGVSFGYGLGDKEHVGRADFWQSAIFEAADKILVLKGKDPAPAADNWIRSEVNFYLKNDFNFSDLPQSSMTASYVECEIGRISYESFDLSKKYSLKFPLYVSFAHGEGTIPLFFKPLLDENATRQLAPILERNQITEIPERHPIL